MAKYLAKRIFDGYLDYDAVVAKYPKYKDSIDAFLTEWGYFDQPEDQEPTE